MYSTVNYIGSSFRVGAN